MSTRLFIIFFCILVIVNIVEVLYFYVFIDKKKQKEFEKELEKSVVPNKKIDMKFNTDINNEKHIEKI